MYLQVNIGRNVGKQPMSSNDWEDFKREIRETIIVCSKVSDSIPNLLTKKDIEFHHGTGTYNGITEDSTHISAYWEPGFYSETLKFELGAISSCYKQDAVALIEGSELILCTI